MLAVYRNCAISSLADDTGFDFGFILCDLQSDQVLAISNDYISVLPDFFQQRNMEVIPQYLTSKSLYKTGAVFR